MNMHPFIEGLSSSPDFLLQNIDLANRRALVIRVNEVLYRQASFLDDRILSPQTEGFWLPLESIFQSLEDIRPSSPHCIFHVGHCGSTLISRLLAELPGCLPVREPMPLLTLALARRELERPSSWLTTPQWDGLLRTTMWLLSRTYRSTDQSIIKATSATGNLLEVLAPVASKSSSLLMIYINLESYLAVMLRTPDLRSSIHAYSPAWLTDFCRLTGRQDIALADLDDARQVAVKWLTLMTLFTGAVISDPVHARLLNFDKFLVRPEEQLPEISDLFGLECGAEHARKLLNGPLMRSYSKIPSQNFDANMRAQELKQARQQFSAEIQTGLKWADTLCREIPLLAPVAAYLT